MIINVLSHKKILIVLQAEILIEDWWELQSVI